jgi:hypothetical protein
MTDTTKTLEPGRLFCRGAGHFGAEDRAHLPKAMLIPAERADTESNYFWRREMMTGTYT